MSTFWRAQQLEEAGRLLRSAEEYRKAGSYREARLAAREAATILDGFEDLPNTMPIG